MVQEGSVQRAAMALQPIKAALNADGADLMVEEGKSGIVVEVVATDQTCAECLLPEEMLKRLVEQKLTNEDVQNLKFVYPKQSRQQ